MIWPFGLSGIFRISGTQVKTCTGRTRKNSVEIPWRLCRSLSCPPPCLLLGCVGTCPFRQSHPNEWKGQKGLCWFHRPTLDQPVDQVHLQLSVWRNNQAFLYTCQTWILWLHFKSDTVSVWMVMFVFSSWWHAMPSSPMKSQVDFKGATASDRNAFHLVWGPP